MSEQLMKDKGLKVRLEYPTKLNLVCITWNLFGSTPPSNDLASLFCTSSFEIEPDLIVFGTQECQRSFTMSFFCQSKSLWEDQLIEALPNYTLVATQTLVGLHLAVLVAKKWSEYTEIFGHDVLRGGTCNVFGSKGAISLEMALLGQHFQFINCHLSAQQEESEARNHLIDRILEKVVNPDPKYEVIFLGDFNYRIDMQTSVFLSKISNKPNTEEAQHYTALVELDQLNRQRQLRADFLLRFREGDIRFPPTYKIGIRDQQYANNRIPGWTDRIFHRRSEGLHQKKYSSEHSIFGSDHRPVLAVFQKSMNEGKLHSADEYVKVNAGRCTII